MTVTWLIIASLVIGILLGTMCGYYVRIHWKRISGFDENARGFLQRVEDTARGWYDKGYEHAREEFRKTTESLKQEIRELQEKLNNKE